MKCFSMFSGIGGFDLALERQGHEIVGACEIDRYARQIYARHFPKVKIWEDATKIKTEQLPDFELLVAGFPCQAFSVAGKRLGFKESRGTLFFEIARVTKQKRPRLLLLENVRGLLFHDKGKTFEQILTTLDELGYDAQWQVCDSKYFVPQRRERVFIIANLRGTSRPKVFPITESNRLTDTTCTKAQGKRERVQGTYTNTLTSTYYKGWGGDRTMIAVKGTQKATVYDSKGLHPTLSAGTHGWANGYISVPKLKKLIDNADAQRVYDADGLARTIKAEGGGQGAKTGLYAIRMGQTTSNGRHIKTDGEPTFTLDTSGNLGVYDGKHIRKLTPLECERLQGFPDLQTDGLSDTQRYKCLGNAVTVTVVEFIVERLE